MTTRVFTGVLSSYLDSFSPSLTATDGGNADFAGAKICPACFQTFLTTTASADFSQTLIREISPGKVLKLSARAAKLYLMRLSVTVGFRVP